VRVITKPQATAIDRLCREIYAVSLADLEIEWHDFVRKPAGTE
jgi:hypothetical protein